jgi:23S rRNA pseudouridine2605 synthase
MKTRLSKTLAAAGIASRRLCEEIIWQGRVSVNGETVLIPQTPVDREKDVIIIDGSILPKQEKKVYFLLNKPSGYHCTNIPYFPKAKKVLDFFSHLPYRLFTVGRLDKETTGLIIVTNDGAFANRVIHPSFNIDKEYLAKTDQEISHDHLMQLSKGTTIEGVFVRPLQVKKVRKGTVKITVSEGKKREVRLLLERTGLKVLSLSRIRVGSLLLGPLLIGHWRELTSKEIEAFR